MGPLVGLEVACESRDRPSRSFGAAAGLEATLMFSTVEEDQAGVLGRLPVALVSLGQEFVGQALPLYRWGSRWGMGRLAAEKNK